MKQIIQLMVLLTWPVMLGLAEGTAPMPEYSNIPDHYYHTYMAPQNCSPIKDFYYDRPFVFGPPYLVTEDYLEGKQTLIMACKTNNSSDEYQYKLIIFSRKYSIDEFAKYEKFKACPSQIPFFHRPGGLSMTDSLGSNTPMDSTFYPVLPESIDERLADQIKITTPIKVISSSSLGGRIDFLCVDGSWYFRMIH